MPKANDNLPAVAADAAPTPMQLVQLAVQQNADPQRLKELLELQERWEANEAKKAFYKALNDFKENPPDIIKNRHVKFGATEYDHATLDKVCQVIGRALSKYGLSHRWETKQNNGNISVTCILQHVRGHSEGVTLDAPPDNSGSKNSIQAVGSTVTYLQRYTLLAATGMATKGQDDDGIRASSLMPEQQRVDFENAIDALIDTTKAEALWKTIAAECKKLGDIITYDELKKRITAKGKALKGQK